MDEVTASEAQVSLALATLGVAVGQTLLELGGPEPVLVILQRKAQVGYARLRQENEAQAARMFSAFVSALRDPRHFDQTDEEDA
jgi:hypothetical protein